MNNYSYICILKRKIGQDMKMEEIAYILKSIAQPTRLCVVRLLAAEGEKNVSEIRSKLQCEQSLLSHHLTDMRAKGILHCRKEGKRCFYSLKDAKLAQVIDCVSDCTINNYN